MRAVIATHETIGGLPRKLAWFALHGKGFYFDIIASLCGSHTSYHVDGNVFRTSPATDLRPRFQGKYLPLSAFRGWRQFGFGMVNKEQLINSPSLKEKDRKPPNIVETISINDLPAESINLVVELLHRDLRHELSRPEIQPPEHAVLRCIELGELLVVVTVLGHENNLVIRPTDNGFQANHFNDRYSANRPGATYHFEAYR